MKKLIILSLILITVGARAQKKPVIKKASEVIYYTNQDSIKKWGKACEFYLLIGFTMQYKCNGIVYNDTTNYPPRERLKDIGDSIIPQYSVKYVPVVVYMTKCDSCTPTLIGCYRLDSFVTVSRFSLYEDILTKKHFTSDGFAFSPNVDRPCCTISYVDPNKQKFPSNYKFWKEQ